jgi:hypothetical protein
MLLKFTLTFIKIALKMKYSRAFRVIHETGLSGLTYYLSI